MESEKNIMDSATPENIGRYQIESTLGAGGMGVVYLARDPKLDRKVAIKCLKAEATNGNAEARIRREAQLLAQLNHPNIVQLHDVIDESGQLALVMEYVEGSTLRHWMREHNAPLSDKLGLLIQICSGLTKAHSEGVIHRDLKPDNILITNSGEAKITDFGIAKSRQLPSATTTAEDHIAGTVTAMSPEQALGQELDARSDIFSFGVIAYELICGNKPFGDESNALAYANRVINEDPVPPKQAWPNIPEPLEALLENLLQKDKGKRPEAASDVSNALLLLMQDDSAHRNQEFSETATRLLKKHRPRRPWLLSSAAIAGLAIAGLVAKGLLVPSHQEPTVLALAPTKFSGTEQAEYRVNLLEAAVADTVRQVVFSSNTLQLSPSRNTVGIDPADLESFVSASGSDAIVQPSIDCKADTCSLTSSIIDREGGLLFEHRDFLAGSGYTDIQSILSYTLNNAFSLQGAPVATQMSAEDQATYLEIFQAVVSRSVFSPEQLSQIDALLGEYPQELKLHELKHRTLILGHYATGNAVHLETARTNLDALLEAGAAPLTLNRLRAELAIYDRSLDFEKQLQVLQESGESRRKLAHLKAIAFESRNKAQESLAAANEALEYFEDKTMLFHRAKILAQAGSNIEDQGLSALDDLEKILTFAPNDHKANTLKGTIALSSGDFEMAVEAYTVLVNNGPDGRNLANLGLAQMMLGKLAPAKQSLQQALEINPDHYGALVNLAGLERDNGSRETAANLFRQYLTKFKDQEGMQHSALRAQAYATLGDTTNATRQLREALELNDTVPFHLFNIAIADLKMGNQVAALVSLERALENGLNPVWLNTPELWEICGNPVFAGLLSQHEPACREYKNGLE